MSSAQQPFLIGLLTFAASSSALASHTSPPPSASCPASLDPLTSANHSSKGISKISTKNGRHSSRSSRSSPSERKKKHRHRKPRNSVTPHNTATTTAATTTTTTTPTTTTTTTTTTPTTTTTTSSPLFVKNLPPDLDAAGLERLFAAFGPISANVARHEDKSSKGFGFVVVSCTEEALSALNGRIVDGRPLYVSRAQHKEDRAALLRLQREELQQERQRKLAGTSLFVGNLPEEMDCEGLSRLFPGAASAKVMRGSDGVGRGYGFVSFVEASQAARAQQAMDGVRLRGRALKVASNTEDEDWQDFQANTTMEILNSSLDRGRHNQQQKLQQKQLEDLERVPDLSAMLDSVPKESRTQWLGERLYVKVGQVGCSPQCIQAKVTGMLLELDRSEVLELLSSAERLRLRVREARALLRDAARAAETAS